MYFVSDTPIKRSGADGDLGALILEGTQNPLVVWDEHGSALAFNDAFCELFGYTPEIASELDRLSFAHPEERAAASEFIDSRQPGDLSKRHWRQRALGPDGELMYLDCVSVGLSFQGRDTLLVEFRDVTEREQDRIELDGLRRRYRRIVTRAPIAIFTTDRDNHFRSANPTALTLLKHTLSELRELTPADLTDPSHRAEALRRREVRNQRNRSDEPFEMLIKQGAGESLWCEIMMLPRYDEDGEFLGVDGFARDISEERRLQQQLEVQASSDPLTGVANRRRFNQVVEGRMSEALRYATPLSLLMIDLDHFKQINDRLGHLAGDAVLRSVSEALTEVGRDTDLVARLGGEEFAVVLAQTDAAGAAIAAERCRTAIEGLTTDWEGEPVRATASVGVATFHAAIHPSQSKLLADADAAVYAAKHAGRNTVCVANDLAPEIKRAA